jgi:hypothetical protein
VHRADRAGHVAAFKPLDDDPEGDGIPDLVNRREESVQDALVVGGEQSLDQVAGWAGSGLSPTLSPRNSMCRGRASSA